MRPPARTQGDWAQGMTFAQMRERGSRLHIDNWIFSCMKVDVLVEAYLNVISAIATLSSDRCTGF